MKKTLSIVMAFVIFCASLMPYSAFALRGYPLDMSDKSNWDMDRSLTSECVLYDTFHSKSEDKRFDDQIHFYDKNGAALQYNTDYTISAYRDAERTVPVDVSERGLYYLTINFTGNYTGSYDMTYGLYPYVDSDGIYHRISNSADTVYLTDHNEVESKFKTALNNREQSVTCNYVTTNSKYAYSASAGNAGDSVTALFNALMYSVYTDDTDDPLSGDYLFRSVYSYNTVFGAPSADSDVIDGTPYYTFHVGAADIKYYDTRQQEQYVRSFIEQFNKKYITADMSQYEKVKTIYDFIVRNTSYDYDVYNKKYSVGSTRYNIAHSAYGAICGNLLASGANDSDFDWSTKTNVQGQCIPAAASQGLAVCEGYSKLFYALCISNGIKCHIVDGDYSAASSKGSDPHEWNYVYLDDGSGSGYQWYQVDTTFASQTSFKTVEYVNYDYFLRGSSNAAFSESEHQQPYAFKKIDFTASSNYNIQLFDWYSDAYRASVRDYRFPAFSSSTLKDDIATLKKALIVRNYKYGGKSYASYMYLDTGSPEDSHLIYVDENGTYLKNAHGFSYNGVIDCSYYITVPYVVNAGVTVNGSQMVNVGQYTVKIEDYPITFNIVPLDIGKNCKTRKVQSVANYTGAVVSPNVTVVDGFSNKLLKGRDFDVKVYSDSAHTKADTIRNIGKYYVDIAYKGNYTGHYYFTFTMGRIKLSTLNIGTQNFTYLPVYLRKTLDISTPRDYFIYGTESNPIKVGSLAIKANTDYTVSYSGKLNYGSTGKIKMSGSGTSKVISGYPKSFSYKVGTRYNISNFNLNGKAATSKVYTYTGSAIKPSTFANINKYLIKGSEYKITGYSNYTKAGKAYVTIQGIGGCTGKAKMYYTIGRANINNAKLKTTKKSGKVYCSLTYKGKKLVKGKDYKEKRTRSGRTVTIKLTGIGNYRSYRTVKYKS